MDMSIFPDKSNIPDQDALIYALGDMKTLWDTLRDYVFQKYPDAVEGWNYPGKKYGWSFRIKDKKRAIIYLLPRDHFFKVAFVFGKKATHEVMKSPVSEDIKEMLESAKVYAEGRGIRIDVRDKTIINDIMKLIDIKLSN